MDCSLPGFSVHGIFQARILKWIAIFLFQEIFLTQGLNPSLPHCRQMLYSLSHQGSHIYVYFSLNFSLCISLWVCRYLCRYIDEYGYVSRYLDVYIQLTWARHKSAYTWVFLNSKYYHLALFIVGWIHRCRKISDTEDLLKVILKLTSKLFNINCGDRNGARERHRKMNVILIP